MVSYCAGFRLSLRDGEMSAPGSAGSRGDRLTNDDISD